MASTSSTPQGRSILSPKSYDVFISHRGPDVKHTLAKQLYDLLKENGCKAFLDREEIEGGESITSVLHNAICSSRVQISIFSKGYAESNWCLDELLLMLQQTDVLFIPVFYGVEPKELRSTDRGSYAAAFSYYQSKDKYQEKAEVWKKALASAAGISGYEDSVHKDNLCEKIVSRVVKVIQEKRKNIHLHVAKYPVGLDELIQDYERCCPKTTEIVGIFGLGGSGKTTLAKELFNSKRSGYKASCFLSDVREYTARGELHCLQSQLLRALGGDEEIRSVDHGIGKLKEQIGRARHLHCLIILDDIDHEIQLDALLPEGMIGSGNMVIITTRDQGVLRDANIRYKMKGMNKDRAKELFCSHAFHGGDTPAGYEKLVESFVKFCGGLPLSLIVLGAHVYCRNEDYWELELEKVKKIQPKDIMQRLKISFDSLDTEEKQIFMDVACLFNKIYGPYDAYDVKSKAITIWRASGWSAEHAVQTLQDKCLLEVDELRFKMHDHLRDLGRQMTDVLGPPRLWRSELLRSMEAKGFKQILADTKGRCFHSFRDSSLRWEIVYFIAENDLIWLDLDSDGNSLSIPSWIPLQKLHILIIGRVEELWSNFQQQLQINTQCNCQCQANCELRKLRIWSSPSLQKLPDLIEMFSHLEELEIYNALEKTDTTSFVQSIKQLSNLRSLQLQSTGCGFFRGNFDLSKGRDLINSGSSASSRLETITLSSLLNISKLVISGEMCPRLQELYVRDMENLKEMELNTLERLNTLGVYACPQLKAISGLSSLMGLQTFKLEDCAGLKRFPTLCHLRHLEQIRIARCRELQSLQWAEELPVLRSLFIGIPDDSCASLVPIYIYGLRRLPVKKTMQIIFQEKSMDKVSFKLNANLFYEVIASQEVSEIVKGDYSLKIESSSCAITIYALLVTPLPRHLYGYLDFESELEGGYSIYSPMDYLIIILLTQHDIEGNLSSVRIKKGFKVTLKVGEEGKALTVLQRIADRLYPHSKVPNLAANDVVKQKRKQMN